MLKFQLDELKKVLLKKLRTYRQTDKVLTNQENFRFLFGS
jgi:hypothetical protein